MHLHMRDGEGKRVELTHFVRRFKRWDVRWVVLSLAVKCPGTNYVARREGGVVVLKGPGEAKVPARVNSGWARRDPDT